VETTQMDRAYARRKMVQQQVRTWDVFDDETLALLNTLNRHDFVPPEFTDLAYAECRIPLPHGQEMMRPLLEGRLLQALNPGPDERVLEIGAGSGFLTACLCTLSKAVVSLDIFEDLAERARENVEKAGLSNAEFQVMDATRELPEGSFDVIAVTGSMSRFDERLVDALTPTGRLFVIVGDAPIMEAWLVQPATDGWAHQVLFETSIRPLVNAERKAHFEF